MTDEADDGGPRIWEGINDEPGGGRGLKVAVKPGELGPALFTLTGLTLSK